MQPGCQGRWWPLSPLECTSSVSTAHQLARKSPLAEVAGRGRACRAALQGRRSRDDRRDAAAGAYRTPPLSPSHLRTGALTTAPRRLRPLGRPLAQVLAARVVRLLHAAGPAGCPAGLLPVGFKSKLVQVPTCLQTCLQTCPSPPGPHSRGVPGFTAADWQPGLPPPPESRCDHRGWWAGCGHGTLRRRRQQPVHPGVSSPGPRPPPRLPSPLALTRVETTPWRQGGRSLRSATCARTIGRRRTLWARLRPTANRSRLRTKQWRPRGWRS